MNNLTVRAKLAWSFGLLALVVLLISGFALKSLSDANQRFESFVNGISERLEMAGDVRNAVSDRPLPYATWCLSPPPRTWRSRRKRSFLPTRQRPDRELHPAGE